MTWAGTFNKVLSKVSGGGSPGGDGRARHCLYFYCPASHLAD